MFFALRIGLIAGLVALLALSCLSLLAGHGVKKGLEGLEIARFHYLVSSLKTTVEANLSLGLPIQDLPALQSRIERDRAAEANVQAIEIVGPNDIALYSTDRGAIGDSIPLAWQRAIEDHHGPTWVAYDRGEVAIAETIVNDFDQQVGHVVLIVAENQVTPPAALTLRFAMMGWQGVLAATLAVFLLGTLLTLHRESAIKRAREIWRGTWNSQRSQQYKPDHEPLGPSLQTACRRARDTTEEAIRALDRAKRRLMDLDDAV